MQPLDQKDESSQFCHPARKGECHTNLSRNPKASGRDSLSSLLRDF
jgi:hypothetical protein